MVKAFKPMGGSPLDDLLGQQKGSFSASDLIREGLENVRAEVTTHQRRKALGSEKNPESQRPDFDFLNNPETYSDPEIAKSIALSIERFKSFELHYPEVPAGDLD